AEILPGHGAEIRLPEFHPAVLHRHTSRLRSSGVSPRRSHLRGRSLEPQRPRRTIVESRASASRLHPTCTERSIYRTDRRRRCAHVDNRRRITAHPPWVAHLHWHSTERSTPLSNLSAR